jgi:hypothetical protein
MTSDCLTVDSFLRNHIIGMLCVAFWFGVTFWKLNRIERAIAALAAETPEKL